MHSFQFRWIPFIATCVLTSVFLRLGWWQWTKSLDVEAQVELRQTRSTVNPVLLGTALADAQALEGASVVVRGHFDASEQFFIDNQQHQGQPGLHVITPLQIEGSQVRVLVNRGWVGWGASRAVLPDVKVPTGLIEIQGRATVPSGKAPAFVTEPTDTGALRTRIRLKENQTSHDYPVQPMVILMMSSDTSDGLVKDWPELANKAPMHKGYAAQWFLMALLLVGFFLRSSYRKENV